MKRWAVLTVALYALALLLLTAPVLLIAFGGWAKNSVTVADAFKFYLNWSYWLWLAVMIASQALLLLVPIDLSEKRLPARRKLKVPVIVGGLLLGNLFLAGLFSLLCVAFKDDAFNLFGFTDAIVNRLSGTKPGDSTWGSIVSIIIVTAVLWAVWAAIFRHATRADEPEGLMLRLKRWLLRGSILELLIAVPSHVIVRRREDCCAPGGTFWGIATGISVMLLCFGPGVYYLFAERFARLKPKPAQPGQTRWHN
jgi:hypothetical protein